MIEFKVPATSANLGPGYDSLGLALSLYNNFKLKKRNDSLIKIEIIDKLSNQQINIDKSDNLLIKAYKRYYSHINKDIEGVEITEEMNTPLARGLGSSSSAIIGGLAAAAVNSGKLISRNEFIQLAVELEKHPDNVVPALVGGLTINFYCNNRYDYYKIEVDQDLDFILIVPDFELKTNRLRKVLPEKIDYQDAVSNLGRVSLLTSVFINKDYQLLKTAMEDSMHQPYRKKLIRGFDEVLDAAYKNGAYGAALSGAGPTILAVADKNLDSIASSMIDVFKNNSINAVSYTVKASNKDLYQELKEENFLND